MLISTLLELSPNDIIQIYAWTDDSAVAQVCPTVPEDCELNITQISGAAAAAGPQGPQGATGADGPTALLVLVLTVLLVLTVYRSYWC